MFNDEIIKKLNEVIEMNNALMEENKRQKEEINVLKGMNSISENIEVGCNAVMGVTLASQTGDIQIDVKYGETIFISSEDIKTLLKNNKNRKLFSECIVYFVDDEKYSYFGIKKRIDLSNKKIIEVINSNNEEEIISYFDNCTSRKFEMSVMNTLFYKIVIMNYEKEFGIMPYEARSITENYFGMKIDDATKLYNSVKNLT